MIEILILLSGIILIISCYFNGKAYIRHKLKREIDFQEKEKELIEEYCKEKDNAINKKTS